MVFDFGLAHHHFLSLINIGIYQSDRRREKGACLHHQCWTRFITICARVLEEQSKQTAQYPGKTSFSIKQMVPIPRATNPSQLVRLRVIMAQSSHRPVVIFITLYVRVWDAHFSRVQFFFIIAHTVADVLLLLLLGGFVLHLSSSIWKIPASNHPRLWRRGVIFAAPTTLICAPERLFAFHPINTMCTMCVTFLFTVVVRHAGVPARASVRRQMAYNASVWQGNVPCVVCVLVAAWRRCEKHDTSTAWSYVFI